MSYGVKNKTLVLLLVQAVLVELGPCKRSNIPERQEGWAVQGQEAVTKYQLPRVNVMKTYGLEEE